MLYFDEAGYTGADLTNREQPFFTLASTNITEEEVLTIKEAIGYNVWGKELHFKSMYTNYQGREILNKLFMHPLMTKEHIKLAYADKRYCIYAHIVNILIETYWHYQGDNIYQGGKSLFIANFMYYGAVANSNQTLVEELENNYVTMIRRPSAESIADFYRTTDILRFEKSTNRMLKQMLDLIPPTIQYISEIRNLGTLYMDLTIPLFVDIANLWYMQTGVKDDIKYDTSEPLYAFKDLLESTRDMDHEEVLVGYGDKKHVYPLPIGEMSQADSKDEFGIQVADIFASALTFILTPRNDKYTEYQDYLRTFPIFQKVDANIAPSTAEYIKQRMKDTEGVDPLDFICENSNLHKLKEKKYKS